MIGGAGPLRPSVWPLCQALLEFIEFELRLTKRLQRQPSRAILIAATMISHGGLHLLESRGLERPAATSCGHHNGRQSGRRDGADHRHAWPSGRRAIEAPNRRTRPRRVTRSCPLVFSVGSVRGIRRRTSMDGYWFHFRRGLAGTIMVEQEVRVIYVSY